MQEMEETSNCYDSLSSAAGGTTYAVRDAWRFSLTFAKISFLTLAKISFPSDLHIHF